MRIGCGWDECPAHDEAEGQVDEGVAGAELAGHERPLRAPLVPPALQALSVVAVIQPLSVAMGLPVWACPSMVPSIVWVISSMVTKPLWLWG